MLYSSHGMIVRRMEKLVTSGLLSHSEGGYTSPRKDAGLSRCWPSGTFFGHGNEVPGIASQARRAMLMSLENGQVMTGVDKRSLETNIGTTCFVAL